MCNRDTYWLLQAQGPEHPGPGLIPPSSRGPGGQSYLAGFAVWPGGLIPEKACEDLGLFLSSCSEDKGKGKGQLLWQHVSSFMKLLTAAPGH